jgi:hypothetical protein
MDCNCNLPCMILMVVESWAVVGRLLRSNLQRHGKFNLNRTEETYCDQKLSTDLVT